MFINEHPELSFANMLVESGMLDDAERNSTEFDT